MRKAKIQLEFSSLFGQPKWLCEIKINNFRCDRKNKQLIKEVKKAVTRYNRRAEDV